jgi:tetratricopeptide (TPR) repeat protein
MTNASFSGGAVAPSGSGGPARRLVIGGAIAGAVLVAAALAWRTTHAVPHAGPAIDAAPAVAVAGAPHGDPPTDAMRRDQDIALFTSAVQQDPSSAYFRTKLALLYLQRARETGSAGDVVLAEQESRASLTARTQQNGAAFATLISALLEQHRFAEAGRFARQLVAGEPEVPAYRAQLGEVEMELGNYAAAGAAFDSVVLDRGSLGIASRLARWAEIRGDTALARDILQRAESAARVDNSLPREQVAWFALRTGDHALRTGALPAAERSFRRGLDVSPDDYRLLAAMARLAAARHDWRGAIDFGDRTIAAVLDPATLGLVGDAYAALGDTAKAEEYYRTMEVAVRTQPGAFHRAWGLSLLDHRRRLGEVERRVRAELETRHDIYGYDLLAWALYEQGRYPAARAAMTRALSQGTQDGVLFYHAGMIERAAGNPARARELLTAALAVNAEFDPTHPAAARATLDSLARELPATPAATSAIATPRGE